MMPHNKMKITKAQKVNAYLIETNENEYNRYTRYGSDSWYVTIGESDEPVYSCGEIELLFQKYIRERGEGIK